MSNVVIKVGVMLDRSVDTLLPRIDAATKQAASAATRNMAGATNSAKSGFANVMGMSEAQLKKHLGDLGYSAKVLDNTKKREAKIIEDAEKRNAAIAERWAKLRQRIVENSFKWEQAARERDERAAIASTERKSRQDASALRAKERLFETIRRNSFRMEQSDRERHDRLVASDERRERTAGIRGRARSIRRAFGAIASAVPGMPTSLEGAALLPLTAAVSMGRNLASGMGMDFDYGSGAGRAMNLERMANRLSNSAYMPGTKGPNNTRVDPRKLIKEAYAIGNELGEDPMEALEGMSKFVAKTGDLAAVRPVMRELGMLSKAFGTDLGDMANAAADVALQLGDVKDKGEVIASVMRNVAAQGKMGAVEVSDLARQMAKVAKGAQFFEGGGAANVQTFTAMAQMAKAHGGAASPTAAATAVDSWVNQFNKAARIGGMEKLLGKNFIRGTTNEDLYKRPELIVAQALKNSRGRMEKMGGAFADSQAAKVNRAASFLYQEGVREFDKNKDNKGKSEEERATAGANYYLLKLHELTAATVSHAELMGSLALVEHDMKSEVQRFNNEMTNVSGELAHQFLPVLVGLLPLFKRFATGMSDVLEVFGFRHAGESAKAASTAGAIQSMNYELHHAVENKSEMTPEEKEAAAAKIREQQEDVDASRAKIKEAMHPTGITAVGVELMDALAAVDRVGRAATAGVSFNPTALVTGDIGNLFTPEKGYKGPTAADILAEDSSATIRENIGRNETGWNTRDAALIIENLRLLTLVMIKVADKKDPDNAPTGAPAPVVKGAGRTSGAAKAGAGPIDTYE